MAAAAAMPPAVRPAPWRPPPFCRTSWASEAARALWEPRLIMARDAIEDLAVLRCAGDGRLRFAFVRPASLERLCALARHCRTSLAGLDAPPAGVHDVAAGRAGRIMLALGDGARRDSPPPAAAACEDCSDRDPVWRLALATPGAESFGEGRGLTVAGAWAVNPLLVPVGLAATLPWPRSFACAEAEAEGEALLACAAAHGRDEAIGYLRQILSWPVAWTALHGVAEVKTPVFRFIRSTPATAQRLTVHRLGAALPEGASRGLGFPFARRTRRGGAA